MVASLTLAVLASVAAVAAGHDGNVSDIRRVGLMFAYWRVAEVEGYADPSPQAALTALARARINLSRNWAG
jgi:hypothetical protein